jgi:hypothetical protein
LNEDKCSLNEDECSLQMMAEVDDMVDGKATENAELIKKLNVP